MPTNKCARCDKTGTAEDGVRYNQPKKVWLCDIHQEENPFGHTCEEWCHCRTCGGFKMGGIPYGSSCSCESEIPKVCRVKDCQNPNYGDGFCHQHEGDPLKWMNPMKERA